MASNNRGNNASWLQIVVALIGAAGVIIAALIATQATGPKEESQTTSVAGNDLSPTSTSILQPTIINTSQPTLTSTARPTATAKPQPPTVTSPTDLPTATFSPTHTPTPQCEAGCVLYQANWETEGNTWPQAYGWKTLDNMLVNDGSNHEGMQVWKANWIAAPYDLTGIDDYAVEAEIEVVSSQPCGTFGLIIRDGYRGGIYMCAYQEAHIAPQEGAFIADRAFDPSNKRHTYRFEAKGNKLQLIVDGAVVVEATDNRYLSGSRVGLVSEAIQLNVYSFTIIKL